MTRKDIHALDSTIEPQLIEMTGKNKLSNVLIGTIYQPSSKSKDKIDWLDKSAVPNHLDSSWPYHHHR